MGFHLPLEANFDKMLSALKGKLINWSTCRLSLAGRILVANQVLLASMWYLAASWNPNPRMCCQVRGVVRNFIWSGKATNARTKVKWETLVLPTSQGGLRIIDPKTQSEALLAKLLIRGLEPGGEPWKKLLRHKANRVMLPVHGLGPTTKDINWLFTASKLKRPPTSLWKSILNAWMNVRPGLSKSEPSNAAKVLRQPVFGNPLITNQDNKPLGLSGKSEGNALANAGYSRVGNFWDPEAKTWKSLSALGMSFHANSRLNRDLIVASIPWDPTISNNKPLVGDWVSKKEADQIVLPEWVYKITNTNLTTANAKEFKKSSDTGRVQATSAHNTTIPLEGYEPVRVLAQDGLGTTLKLAKDLLQPGKKPPIYWIFESGFISGPKDAKGTLRACIPSKESCSRRGKLRRRWAWPPGRLLDPLARIGLRTVRIALSRPLRLNGFTATYLGRARPPFRGASSPPCTFSISLMIDGAIASPP